MAKEMPLQQRLRRCQWFYIVPGEDRGLREGGCPQEAAGVLDRQQAEITKLRSALDLAAAECDHVHDDLLTAGKIDDDWEKRLAGVSQFIYEILGLGSSHFADRTGIKRHAERLHRWLAEKAGDDG